MAMTKGSDLLVAALENEGIATGVITQNVDGLHLRAGSRRVVELHGTMRRVLCLHCGQVFDRRDLAARATDALNAQVFAAPGLTPTDLEALVDVIGRMRSDAGDF